MKLKLGLICVFLICLICYIVIFINTNSVVVDVKEVMSGKVSITETKGTPLSYYNHPLWVNPKVKVSITRLLVLHNFRDGYMWVRYKYTTIENGKDELPGTGYILSRWKIRRQNDKWKIIDIKEDP